MEKQVRTLFTLLGGIAGGYVPSLWGASYFSMSSLLFGALGAMLGIYIAFKITR